ncbi:MAG: M48 family metallopeptidase [Polyangiaceae bacterium]|jgi:hypothetical protein|nr:M48 family metallopeptidase [Polyangiaceae bacterium]
MKRGGKKGQGPSTALIVALIFGIAAVGTTLAILISRSGDDSADDGGGKKAKKSKSGKSGSSKGGDSDGDGDSDGGGDKGGETPSEGYKPEAEPSIPASVAQGRVDPSQLSKGSGRAVKSDSKEVDPASSLTFTPDSDPYCKEPASITDILKEVGYNIDKELRATASMSDSEEEKIGDELLKEILQAKQFRGKVDTPAMAEYRRYIAELAVPLLVSAKRKGIVYDFHTIDDPTVNAFAIPGGHIFFFRGILEKPRRIENEAQLAGVLAHEINHVDKRHTIAIFEYLKTLGALTGDGADIGAILVSMARHPFSTTQEDESDAEAVKFLIAAEYSPKQFVSMWQNWAEIENKGQKPEPGNPLEELLATHSRPERRACNAMKVTMANKPSDVKSYYVGATNYRQRKPRARQQY